MNCPRFWPWWGQWVQFGTDLRRLLARENRQQIGLRTLPYARKSKSHVGLVEVLRHCNSMIIYEKSNVAFSSRWDHYLHLQNDNIHWFSLINSALIISILSFILLNIFCRALKRDIDVYNTRVTGEDFIDEFPLVN